MAALLTIPGNENIEVQITTAAATGSATLAVAAGYKEQLNGNMSTKSKALLPQKSFPMPFIPFPLQPPPSRAIFIGHNPTDYIPLSVLHGISWPTILLLNTLSLSWRRLRFDATEILFVSWSETRRIIRVEFSDCTHVSGGEEAKRPPPCLFSQSAIYSSGNNF